MAQAAREILSLVPRGWGRKELEAALRAQPRFFRQFERNSKAYSEMLRRLLTSGEIEERDGLLFATERTRMAILAYRDLFEVVR